jgi:glycosyltransferase involved in cell wall biosynthesis
MQLLDATDVLVHPSHFDAFPTTLLEAMAASVPIVATGVGGMLEIVEHEVSGILVPPPPTALAFAHALTPVLADAELRRRLAAGGRARFDREFSALPWVRRLRDTYDAVISARAEATGRGGRRP